MAINWLLALKAVPWGELAQAAPGIVKGARRLFNTARQSEPPPVGPAEAGASGATAHAMPARVARLEAAVQNLDSEQQSSAELLRSLAEQNSRVVAAIEVLRARSRLLLGVSIALAAGYVVLAVWVVTR
jgi:hypothetical protein